MTVGHVVEINVTDLVRTLCGEPGCDLDLTIEAPYSTVDPNLINVIDQLTRTVSRIASIEARVARRHELSLRRLVQDGLVESLETLSGARRDAAQFIKPSGDRSVLVVGAERVEGVDVGRHAGRDNVTELYVVAADSDRYETGLIRQLVKLRRLDLLAKLIIDRTAEIVDDIPLAGDMQYGGSAEEVGVGISGPVAIVRWRLSGKADSTGCPWT